MLALTALIAFRVDAPSQPSSAPPVVSVVGTTLRAQRADGSVLEGSALIGAVLTVDIAGSRLKLRIANVERDPRDTSGEIWLYDFRQVDSGGAETSICNPDPDGRRLGLPLAGRTQADGTLRASAPTDFELVCTSGAQGKCVRFGYAPWRQTADGRPMLDWYNACVRLVRADYCGDGRASTRDGTLIDLYDEVGINKTDDDPTLSFEAAWGPQGALCVAHTRIPENLDLAALEKTCPRLAGKLGPDCRPNMPGALLRNRSK